MPDRPVSPDASSRIIPVALYPDPIPGIIPFGTVTIFAGAPGVGKTAMLADWIARWRDGRPICGHATHRPTAFYYLAADRQWASHAQWFHMVGMKTRPAGMPPTGDPADEIAFYSLADDPAFDIHKLSHGRNAHDHFLHCFNALNPIPGAHVYVDPVSPLFIAGDQNKPRDVAVAMLKFSRLCSKYLINISCAAHFAKQKNDPKDRYTRPQDRISGSGAFSGFTDTQIYMVDPQPPKIKHHVLGWNPRHAPAEEFNFKRNASGLFVPYDGLVDEGKDAKTDRPTQVFQLLPEDGTPISRADLFELAADKFQISLATLKRDLQVLLARGVVELDSWGAYKRKKLS